MSKVIFIRLIGKIKTLIVSSKSNYKKEINGRECKIAISSKKYDDVFMPYKRFSKIREFGKIFTDIKKRPFSYTCHYGYVYVDFLSENYKKDLEWFLNNITQLGKLKNEGMGKIEWIEYKVYDDIKLFESINIYSNKKITIRKKLRDDIPQSKYKLVSATLIHDLIHIPDSHPSKIGFSLDIKDERIKWLVENHHNKVQDNELKILQKADRMSSGLTRKYKTWVQNQIGHGKAYITNDKRKEILNEIESKLNNPYELYDYIYDTKELDNFVESQEYGKSSLREHLLLTTSLLFI